METTTRNDRTNTRRRRRRGIVALLAASAALSLGSGAFSLAVFTDSDDASGAFTTGTVDIATSPATLFTVTGIVPGDSGAATLSVTNGGTAALRYAVTASSTNTDTKGLRDALVLEVRPGTCPTASAAIFGPAAISGALLGDPAQGAQGGDRSLAAAASEDLCFMWSLPLATANAYQDATTTTTFTFAAEQTANNP